MTAEEILPRLIEQICNINVTIEADEIPRDEGLLNAGIIDSFGFVELVTFLESEFGIEIDEGEINEETFANVVEISKFVAGKLSGD